MTETDFERLSWHDCHIWRIEFDVGDSDAGDWTSDLVIGLDYIVEWLCDRATCRFKIAPANLIFHGVTDPKIDIDWGGSGFQAAIHHVSIDRILREQISDQKVFLGRPYYRWSIRMNCPQNAEIAFGAVGFTQTLLAEPVLCDQQRLSRAERSRLLARPPTEDPT